MDKMLQRCRGSTIEPLGLFLQDRFLLSRAFGKQPWRLMDRDDSRFVWMLATSAEVREQPGM
jgi:hypothetical protein